MKLPSTIAAAALLTACATDPALVDPDDFRTAAGNKVERVVDVAPAIAAGNLNGWTVKCWESADIRVKYQQIAADRFQVTLGMYGSFSRALLFLADIEANGNGSRVIVRYRHDNDTHRGYAENIAAGADKSASACNSPITGNRPAK